MEVPFPFHSTRMTLNSFKLILKFRFSAPFSITCGGSFGTFTIDRGN